MENEIVKRLKDFVVADIDVFIIKKGHRWVVGRCLRHTQDREPTNCLIKYPEWMEDHIKEGEHYTLSVSVSMDSDLRTNLPMVGYRVREIKPFIAKPYICSKCKTPHSSDDN